MFRLLSLTLLLALALTALPAAQDDPALVTKSQEFSRLLREKNYAAALAAGDEAIALARKKAHPALGPLLYNKACVLALLGRREEAVGAAREAVAAGYTKYQMFASDSDLDPLRDDPAFRVLLADLREKYGPKPLAWDERRTVDYVGEWDNVKGYVAPRLSFLFSETDRSGTNGESSTESSTSGWDAGVMFGAQYPFNRRFSAFGEVGVGSTNRHAEFKGLSAVTPESDSWSFGPRTAIGMIVYF